MATRTIKSSFLVRKSNRLNHKKENEDKIRSSQDVNSTFDNTFDNDKQTMKRTVTVKSAIKNVFNKKDRRRKEVTQCSDSEGMIEEKNEQQALKSSASNDPNSSMIVGCCVVSVSPESTCLASPASNGSSEISTPVRIGPSLSANELTRACRRLLSPSKRKSSVEGGDENEFEHCSLSPVKSPKTSSEEGSSHRARGGASSHSLNLAHSPVETGTPSSRVNTSRISKIPSSTPRRLFSSPEKPDSRCETPKRGIPSVPNNSPCTPLYKQNAKPYQVAKRCLHTARPGRLVGRDKERQDLEDFIGERLEDKVSGSLYVSGPPGTGKTAVILHVIDTLKSKFPGLRHAFINCMTLKDTRAVFSNIHEELRGSPVKGRDAMKAMERLFVSSSDGILLVLDEIDQLDSKYHDVLYRIFEWPALKNSKLILIGIANALDLTDRVLPRLQASANCRPELMNFAPYTSLQITDILKDRLERDSVVDPSAISFCARKVSAVAGDMRKALDVCRRAVELVEADVRSQTVLKPQDCNSPTKQRAGDTPIRRVNLTHISRVMNDVYGVKLNSSTAMTSESDMPLQQKLAVCSLLVLLKTGKLKEVLLGKLHDAYSRVCRKQQVAPVDQTEFLSVLTFLDTRGIITLRRSKDTRLSKISLKLDEQELESTLKDKILLAAILTDGIPK